MGCKEKIEDCHKISDKWSNIVKGFTAALAFRILPEGWWDGREWILERSAICNECEHRTFLPIMEWGIRTLEAAIKDRLQPKETHDLPINHTPGSYDVLWCSICKCCLEAKIKVRKEDCCIGNWKGIDYGD